MSTLQPPSGSRESFQNVIDKLQNLSIENNTPETRFKEYMKNISLQNLPKIEMEQSNKNCLLKLCTKISCCFQSKCCVVEKHLIAEDQGQHIVLKKASSFKKLSAKDHQKTNGGFFLELYQEHKELLPFFIGTAIDILEDEKVKKFWSSWDANSQEPLDADLAAEFQQILHLVHEIHDELRKEKMKGQIKEKLRNTRVYIQNPNNNSQKIVRKKFIEDSCGLLEFSKDQVVKDLRQITKCSESQAFELAQEIEDLLEEKTTKKVIWGHFMTVIVKHGLEIHESSIESLPKELLQVVKGMEYPSIADIPCSTFANIVQQYNKDPKVSSLRKNSLKKTLSRSKTQEDENHSNQGEKTMATGVECCAACACLQPAFMCLSQFFQNLCGSDPCVGRDCSVRIQNICSRINVFNHCNCCSSSQETKYQVKGDMVLGEGRIQNNLLSKEDKKASELAGAVLRQPMADTSSLFDREEIEEVRKKDPKPEAIDIDLVQNSTVDLKEEEVRKKDPKPEALDINLVQNSIVEELEAEESIV